jgi:hypothetical protein
MYQMFAESIMIKKSIYITLLSCLCVGLANAQETISYVYDAKGRVKKVQRTGSVNNGVTAEYAHDKANNRRNLKVTGSPS